MKTYTLIERFYLNHFYLVMPLALILLSCIGGFAVYFITAKGISLFNLLQLFLAVAAAMLYLVAVLAQLSPKKSFLFFFSGLLLEAFLLLFNLFF
ncbi:MAG: hypothetical protein EBY37_05165 [Flavobacteriia bacterium]|jgi:hypothetical protein|nr:hypothetical protein [Flavobacteriia bacterium]